MIPSGQRLQFAIENGPVEIVSFPIRNGGSFFLALPVVRSQSLGWVELETTKRLLWIPQVGHQGYLSRMLSHVVKISSHSLTVIFPDVAN